MTEQPGVGPEVRPSPERVVAGFVAQVDRIYDGLGMRREPGERMGICGVSADLSRRSAERSGLSSSNYQIWSIHKEFGIPDPKDAFLHATNITTVDDRRFLIDPSFSQFLDPESGTVRQVQVDTGIRYQDSPLAMELLQNGFTELNDEKLREYMRITSASPDKKYIESVTVAGLLSLDPDKISVPYDHRAEMLDAALEHGTFKH